MLNSTQTALLAKGQRNMHNSTKTIKYREVSADEHAPLLNHRHSTHHTHYSHDTELTDNPMPSTPPPPLPPSPPHQQQASAAHRATLLPLHNRPQNHTTSQPHDLVEGLFEHLSTSTWNHHTATQSNTRHIHHQNFLAECQGSHVHSHRRRLWILSCQCRLDWR